MIAGATTPEQVEQNVGAAGWTLSAEDLAEIDRITRCSFSAPVAQAGTPYQARVEGAMTALKSGG